MVVWGNLLLTMDFGGKASPFCLYSRKHGDRQSDACCNVPERVRSCSPIIRPDGEVLQQFCSVFNLSASEQMQRSRFDDLTLASQSLLIQKAERLRLPDILNKSCSWYASTLSCPKVLQSLLVRNGYGRKILCLGPMASQRIVHYLYQNNKENLSKFVHLMPIIMHRFLAVSADKTKRCDAIVGYSPSSDEVFAIQTDMQHVFNRENELQAERYRCSSNLICPVIVRHWPTGSIQTLPIHEEIGKITDSAQLFHNIYSYQLSPDGTYMLAFSSSDNNNLDRIFVFERDLSNQFEYSQMIPLKSGILSYSTSCHDNLIKPGACVISYDIHKSFAINPMRREAVFVDREHNIFKLNLESGCVSRLLEDGSYTSVAYSPDGVMVAAVADKSTVTLVNAAKHGTMFSKKLSAPVSDIAWWPHSQKLLVATGNNIVALSPVEEAFDKWRLDHEYEVTHVCTNQYGTRILSADTSATIYLWDVQSSQQLLQCTIAEAHIISLALSPNGLYGFITCNQGGVIKTLLWRTRKEFLGEYDKLNDGIFADLGAALSWGSYHSELKNLSLPHMMLLLASRWAQKEGSPYAIRSANFLASHCVTLPGWLQKSVEANIQVLSDFANK